MPQPLYSKDLSLPHIKKLHVSLSDDEASLVFQVEVARQIGDKPASYVTVNATAEQVDIVMRLARIP